MEVLIGIVVVIFGILQIILFFKLWGMTNDVSEIKNFLLKESLEENILSEAGIDGWGENVTDAEKIEAMPLVNKLKPEQVIAKIMSSKRMEIWSYRFWETEQKNSGYKLIYKK